MRRAVDLERAAAWPVVFVLLVHAVLGEMYGLHSRLAIR
jgi:hypothetical protein